MGPRVKDRKEGAPSASTMEPAGIGEESRQAEMTYTSPLPRRTRPLAGRGPVGHKHNNTSRLEHPGASFQEGCGRETWAAELPLCPGEVGLCCDGTERGHGEPWACSGLGGILTREHGFPRARCSQATEESPLRTTGVRDSEQNGSADKQRGSDFTSNACTRHEPVALGPNILVTPY